MKFLPAWMVAILILLTTSARGASDVDVTLLKVHKVVIGESVITIAGAVAKTRITVIQGAHDPAFTGDTWNGMPVARVEVISNEATFTIKRERAAEPGGPLVKAWQDSLKAAKDLQEGKVGGRIGFYTPDIVIKGNRIDSVAGYGFLYLKAK